MNYTGRPSISGCRPVLSLYPTHYFCQYLLRIFITFTNSSLFCRAFSTNSRRLLRHAAGGTAARVRPLRRSAPALPKGEELNLSVSADALPPPLPRGGLGIAENFSSSPEAPLPGELSSEARLRGCTKESLTDMPMAPPLGELAGVSPTERARMLTANPRRCDSIALTKSLPIAAQRFFPAGLALSVTFGDTSPKGRGFGRPEGAKNPPWRSQLLGGFLIAGDESAGFSHFCLYYMRSSAKVKHWP